MRLRPSPTSSRRRRVCRTAAKLAASAALAASLGAVAVPGTFSSFNAVTSNAGTTIATGTVALSDNDAGNAVLSLAAAKPGDTATGCIVVTYGGSLPATVVMYGTTGGTGLDPYLDLKVTRGTISGTPAAGSCTNFTADTTNYIGQGAGVVYSGTLQGWPDTSATGLADPVAGSPATWSAGEAHAYRIQATVRSDAAGQGKTATQTFTWQAANT
jgi:hypothetical protein